MQNTYYSGDTGILGPRQKALIDQLAGGTAVSAPPIQAEPNAPTAPNAAPAKDFSRLTGYDAGKFNANKNDAKYQIGGVLSQFDPSVGFTPDVINALNGLGYGNFSGSGDKLNLQGLTDAGRQAGLTGDYQGADFNQGFKTGHGKWSYSDPVAEAAQARSKPAAGGGALGGTNLPSMLQGDPIAGIQQALSSYQQPGLLQQLIAALGGGNG